MIKLLGELARGLSIFIILIFVSTFLYIAWMVSRPYFGGPDECRPEKGAEYLVTKIGNDTLHIPTKFKNICLKSKADPWPSFILSVSYPEFEYLPKMNKKNRAEILKSRLTITISDNLETRPDIRNIVFKNKQEQIEIIDGVKNVIYPDLPKRMPNGILHYVSKAKRHENMRDMYVQQDYKGNVTFMAQCGPRAVGGGYCSSNYILINDLKIDYSYDISHLDQALEVDRKVRAFIASMIAHPVVSQ